MPQTPPDGFHSVTPYIIVDDADAAIDFYQAAFNAVEVMRLTDDDGRIVHAEVKIGDSHVMLSNEWPDRGILGPKSRGGNTGTLLIYVEDADTAFAQAVKAGGTSVSAVQDQFYGDRSGMITDPFGHGWTLATHIEDVSAEDAQKRMATAMG